MNGTKTGLAVLFISIYIMASCGSMKKGRESKALPGPDGESLFTYITVTKDYTKWSLWPGKRNLHEGKKPHGAFITTYLNYKALSYHDEGETMGTGSIIVVENYNTEKKLERLTVMYKIEGFNPSSRDWFWGEFDQSGKVMRSGKIQDCIACHGQKKENDFVLSSDFVGDDIIVGY